MINYTILIGGQDFTSSCSLPFKEQYCLDESLDNGILNVKMIARSERFKPYTIVSITKNDGATTDTYSYYVANDNVTEIVGTGTYNHDLTLIEETKLLEKIVVDTNTITQSLIKEVQPRIDTKNETYIMPFYRIGGGSSISRRIPYGEVIKIKPTISIYTLTNEGLPSVNSIINNITTNPLGTPFIYDISVTSAKLYTKPYGDVGEQIYSEHSGGSVNIDFSQYTEHNISNLNQNIKLDAGGYSYFYYIEANYKTVYGNWDVLNGVLLIGNIEQDTATGREDDFYALLKPYIALYNPEKVVFSISDVVDKLLTISETQRYGDTPRFTFNAEQQTKYSSVVAPEFSFTKSTLRECLDQVGGYIHAITRLKNGVVYFDELGSQKETELQSDYLAHGESQDIEQFCTDIDTNVDNLVNMDNTNIGTIVEPFARGYETIRAEGQVRITDETAIIETEYPIEKIIKLEVGYLSDETLIGDITNWVYEEADYNTLSSYDAIFDNSKAYAIYYTQGEKNVKGLNFKLDNPLNLIFSHPAIINILEYVTGRQLQSLFNTYGLINLNFRITYIPIVSTRIKQSKAYLEDYDANITSIYNQQANKIDSSAYGENLKGAVARLGNIEKTKTYMLPKIAQIPEVGTLVDDDYYISVVSLENEPNYIKATCGLSKDFNRLNKFIGIKNNLRMYEVSEKQSVERYVIYEDYCIIGDDVNTEDKGGILGQYGIEIFANDFTKSQNKNAISNIILYGLDEDFRRVQTDSVLLPTANYGIGNSIIFTSSYRDNYSAGSKSVDATNSTGQGTYYKVKEYVPYGDYWGRIKYLNFALTDSPYNITSYSQALAVGNKLPAYSDDGVTGTIYAWTILRNGQASNGVNGYPIILEKDNREKISLSYQIHFVSNRKDIVIGSGLAKNCGLINNNNSARSLYILPNKIGKFDKEIDLTGATLVRNYYNTGSTYIKVGNGENFYKITIENETANADGKAWAIVDNSTNANGKQDLIFGKNINIKDGNTISMPTMTFTHKIFD